jgi:hypothetical protein
MSSSQCYIRRCLQLWRGERNSFISHIPWSAWILWSWIHYHFSKDTKGVLDLAIGSAKSLLSAVHKYAPTVKRVIITGSFASIIDWNQGSRSGYLYTSEDWNPVSTMRRFVYFFSSMLLDHVGRGTNRTCKRISWCKEIRRDGCVGFHEAE